MTPDVGKRAPFELLAFTAAPVAGGLVVIKLEGRFMPENGRFTRQPVLVVESGDDRPRLELAPIRARRDDGRWRGVYAMPAEALPDARLALGVRGTLLELPAPDEPDGDDRLSVLAREANNLRRALETAETDAATARAEADAAAAELASTVLGARDSALAESADTIAALEADLAEARARADAAAQRAIDADAQAQVATQAARAAEAGTEVLRAELAEERERSAAVAETTATVEDPDATVVHRPVARAGRRSPAVAPVAPTSPRATADRSPTHWIAVGALVLFAFVLLGLLAGFLG